MKTNALITRKTSLYFLIGFLGIVITSCGSYQNSSYYDSDGIYSTNGEKVVKNNNQSASASVQYKEYFNSLQNTGTSDEIFTDVNSYSNGSYAENDSIQAPSTGYASWGSSPQETTVTVYSDPYWYYGYGWGYPYYGYGWGYPYYGWGYPGYGWGYPGYGWGHPGYGYPVATPYSYNYSRRGSSYGGGYNNSIYNNNRATAYSRNNISGRNRIYNNNTYYRNSSNSFTNRQTATFTNRNNYSTNRNNYSTNRNNSYSTNSASRNYNPSQSRNSNYTQNRTSTSNQNTQRSSSYTPSSNNSYRSSGGGGGARMSSGGGGGRMSGGGRR